jgi:penicillin-binding protein 1C
MRLPRITRRRLAVGVLSLLALVGAGLAAAWLVPLPERLSSPHSVVIEYRDGTPAHVFLAPDERWRVPTRTQDIDPAYLRALLALEDKRFRYHPGVDPLAVGRAVFSNVTKGRRVSGASTLTMQLVRVLEPRPRTLFSKVIESFRAVQLELRMSKEDILAAYLQFVPYGRNVEGVEAAALAYFGHRATHLSPAEIATLLAVPQNPNRRFPTPENAARLKAARDGVARRLLDEEALPLGPTQAPTTPEAVLAEVRSTEVPTALKAFPREAPHAAVWLRAQRPELSRLRTTLDAGTQRLAERLMRDAASSLSTRGVHNGVAVVVDHAALPGLGAQAAAVRHGHRSRPGAARVPGGGHPRVLRRLHAAQLRRALHGAGAHGVRAVPVAQHPLRAAAAGAWSRALPGHAAHGGRG